MQEAPRATDLRHELDRMIVKSFNLYERTQRRSKLDSSLLGLVLPVLDFKPGNLQRKPPDQDSEQD
jgi:hypothetical protein